MFSRKVCTSVLVLSLSLGALSDLHALPPQGVRGETRIQQEFASRIFQDLMDYMLALFESQNGPGVDAPEGPGLCPNGRPRGGQSGNGNGNGSGNGNGNGNGNG